MDSLGPYVGRRLLQAIPLVAAVIALNFALIHMAPGDPAAVLAGESGAATPELIAKLREEFGLDRSLADQFLVYAGKVLRGDLGYSFHDRRAVRAIVAERLPATFLLMTAGFAWALVGGLALGVVAARRAGTWLGSAVSVASMVAYATPVFWLGLMLVVLFGVKLEWLPTHGMGAIGSDARGLARALEIGRHLILPAATLGLFYMALYTRITRASMLEVVNEDFITVARAKGLAERRVILHHALRNAMLGVVTVAGVQVAQVVGGSVLVETIFAWPGMGRLLFDAVAARDYPVLLAVLLVASVAVIVVNLVTDVCYGLLDPRIRHGAGAAA